MIIPLFYLIFLLTSQIISAAGQAYKPTEHILLNCGAASKLNSSDGQSWDADAATKLSPDISTPSLSSPAYATEQDPSISPVPYLTARIIHSKFSYVFPLSSGQKILRLYFYPAAYSTAGKSFNKTQSFFGVTADQYTLLTNFNTSFTGSSQNPTATYFVKEFIVNVRQTQALNLTFLPSPNSYAFINGIEVVSVPANFYMGSHNRINNPLLIVHAPNIPYELDQNFTAFETLYRLNVGGGTITGEGDTGMFRDWLQDDNFLSHGIGNRLSNDDITLSYTYPQTPNFSAPDEVYRTARAMGMMTNQTPSVNLTWSFQVDTGFFYLLRLHFCELMPSLFFERGQKIFTIFINNMTATANADIVSLAGGVGIPVFKDYVISIGNPTGKQSKYDLFLALAPAREFGPTYLDASLNGLEIFKLNSTTGNLAGVNPDILPDPGSSTPNSQQPGKIAGVVGGVVGGGAIITLLILYIMNCRRKGMKDLSATNSSWAPLSTQSKSTDSTRTDGSSPLPSDLCRRFLLEEIKTATSNFDPAMLIGTGGFGNVYRGSINHNLTATAVAIKRSDPCSSQGLHEFRTEIEMLSNLRHLHLVSLIGYCDDDNEMILVYDYMPNGTLRDHLYRTENPPLTWKQRLEICIGAARGLQYLHNEAKQVVIHRDIKSNNILLDGNWVAKISDFGLSKMGAPDESFIHFSTNVKGTFGYLDPEYFSTKKLTRKSDVYAFGVVLFEVLSGRPAVDTRLDEEQHSLATWARSCMRNNQVDELIDSNLEGQISPDCLRLFVGVARRCIDTHPPERPPMADVVVSLDMALGLMV